jgi:hypothetical protein
VLAYSGGIAMHVWTLKGYYDTLPVEIEEAARMDGATAWQSFWRVLLPMALPILVVVFMLAFIGAIIEYPVASGAAHQQDQLTLAVGSKLFVQEHNFHWGDFAAAAILGPAHHSRVPAGPALDDLRPGRRWRQGMSHLINRRHAALAPLAWLGTVGLAGCTTTHTMTSTAPTMDHVPWSRNAAIYEVNLRQFTPEGTLADFAFQAPGGNHEEVT